MQVQPATELFGISAQLTGTETDCALVDLMTDLHTCEALLVERKLAIIAEFFSRRSTEHVARGAWSSTAHELAESGLGAALTMGRAAAGKFIGGFLVDDSFAPHSSGNGAWRGGFVPRWFDRLRDRERSGKTVESNMSAFCRNHHRLKHSDRWRFASNQDRTMSLTSSTGHCHRTRPAGLMAGSHEPIPPQGGRDRRTRAENKAARIQSERNRQHRRIQKRAEKHVQCRRWKSPPEHREPIDYGGDAPPF